MSFKIKRCAALLGLTVVLGSVTVMSADHAESPGSDADPAGDLADVFLFASPEAGSKLVAAMTFGGRAAPRSRIDGSFYCDANVLYTYNINVADAAGNFDNAPEVQVFARFGKNSAGSCGLQLENVPGAGGTFSGPIEQIIGSQRDLRAFAGLRNDPFFFDAEGLTALLNTFAAPGQSGDLASAFRFGQPRRDSFALRNVSAIVFEMDLDAVAPVLPSGARPQFRVWATTARLAS